MTTEQFYQIASCASMIQDLADKGAELSNALRLTNENSEFYNIINYPLDKFEDYKAVINAAADFNKIVIIVTK